MKAVVFHQHGDLDRLQYVDFPEPKIGHDEVLVRVRGCGLNHLDLWTRQGLPGVQIPLPHILGCEVTGEVAQWGRDVNGFKRGESVLVSPGLHCSRCEFCLRGEDSLCLEYKIMGFQVNGGYAQYAKAEARHLIRVSNRLSFEEWAAVPLVFLTAWHMLITRAKLQAGETVLVHAAGSGIGSAAIQIAKVTGASVIATAGSEEKLKKAKKLGADELINYRARDFSKEAKRLTGDRGVDVVFEHIGPETWKGSLASLAKGGRLVTCGATSGPTAEIDLRFLFMKQLSVLGSYMGSRHELLKVLQLFEQGKLEPVVDSVFPLKEAREAQKRMLDRKQFGKIVLKP